MRAVPDCKMNILLFLALFPSSVHAQGRNIFPCLSIPVILLFVTGLILLLLITYICTLFRERKRYAELLKNSMEITLICDQGGRIRESVRNIQTADRLQDMFNNDWEIEQALGTVDALGYGREVHLDITCSRETGDSFYKLIFQNMMNRREIRGICVSIRDITDSKLLEKRLIQAREAAYTEARHDPLTHVPNRLYFNESISQQFARLKRRPKDTMCLLMLDLDHFKNINDTWGHDVGDLVLQQLTVICSDMIRTSDTFARYGGEEFVCILDDLDLKAATEVCERMRQTIEEYHDWPDSISLTVSIGLVQYTGEEDPEDLIKKADIAMYRAKAEGRNKVAVYRR